MCVWYFRFSRWSAVWRSRGSKHAMNFLLKSKDTFVSLSIDIIVKGVFRLNRESGVLTDWLAKQETLLSHGHLVSPLVSRKPNASKLVLVMYQSDLCKWNTGMLNAWDWFHNFMNAVWSSEVCVTKEVHSSFFWVHLITQLLWLVGRLVSLKPV